VSDYDMSIHSNPDGAAWAKFFAETMAKLGQPCPDEDTMQGWFANAMMAMHDHLASRSSPAREPGACRTDPECYWRRMYDQLLDNVPAAVEAAKAEALRQAAREPEGLRERVEALAVEWETEAAFRDRCAEYPGNDARALRVGANFERHHAARLRALAGETRADPLRRMADRFSDPSLRAAAHAGLDAGETREAPGTPAADPGAALATALRLLASEHNVLRKVRLRETFTMEESQAASASWHEAEDFLAAPSPGEDAATTGVIPPEHANECSECHRTFDMRDLTQVMFHTTHQPTAVLNVAPGVRVDAGGAHNKAMRQDERPVVDVICPGCAAHVPSNDSHLLTCAGLSSSTPSTPAKEK
jgi:hypothetical protein